VKSRHHRQEGKTASQKKKEKAGKRIKGPGSHNVAGFGEEKGKHRWKEKREASVGAGKCNPKRRGSSSAAGPNRGIFCRGGSEGERERECKPIKFSLMAPEKGGTTIFLEKREQGQSVNSFLFLKKALTFVSEKKRNNIWRDVLRYQKLFRKKKSETVSYEKRRKIRLEKENLSRLRRINQAGKFFIGRSLAPEKKSSLLDQKKKARSCRLAGKKFRAGARPLGQKESEPKKGNSTLERKKKALMCHAQKKRKSGIWGCGDH